MSAASTSKTAELMQRKSHVPNPSENVLLQFPFPDAAERAKQDRFFDYVYAQNPSARQLLRDGEAQRARMTEEQQSSLGKGLRETITEIILAERAFAYHQNTLATLLVLTPLDKYHNLRSLLAHPGLQKRITCGRLLMCDLKASPRPEWLSAYIEGRIDADRALSSMICEFVATWGIPEARSTFAQTGWKPEAAVRLWEFFSKAHFGIEQESGLHRPIIFLDHVDVLTHITPNRQQSGRKRQQQAGPPHDDCLWKFVQNLATSIPHEYVLVTLFNEEPTPCLCRNCRKPPTAKSALAPPTSAVPHGSSPISAPHEHQQRSNTRSESEVAALRDLLEITNELLAKFPT